MKYIEKIKKKIKKSIIYTIIMEKLITKIAIAQIRYYKY